jgi:hypothetical protein
VKGEYVVPYFNTTKKEYFYNANLDVFGNSISGILVVKKIDVERKRLALLSEFGNTLLDFEFYKDEVKVIYIMEDLNKKFIVKKLKRYFQLLVHSKYEIKKSYSVEGDKVHISKLQGKRIFLNLNDLDQLLYLKQVSVLRNKIDIHFYGESEYLDSIVFKSYELPITIGLKKRN